MNNIGRQIKVNLNDGSVIQGWDFGESPLGQYVALDRNAKDIRFLPSGTYVSCCYSYNDMAPLDSEIDASYTRTRVRLESDIPTDLSDAILRALDRTDFNEIRKLAQAFAKLQNRFHGSYNRLTMSNVEDGDIKHGVAETVIESKARYLQLLDDIDHSGLLSVLVEHGEIIRKEPLPHEDWYYYRYNYRPHDRLILESMYFEAQKDEVALEKSCGRHVLQHIQVDALIEALNNPTSKEPHKETESEWPKRLRVIAASGKIVIGGGFATTNLGAGFVAGIMTAIPTLGIGAIASALGVATSAYTGLNAACDGVKDLATALEDR